LFFLRIAVESKGGNVSLVESFLIDKVGGTVFSDWDKVAVESRIIDFVLKDDLAESLTGADNGDKPFFSGWDKVAVESRIIGFVLKDDLAESFTIVGVKIIFSEVAEVDEESRAKGFTGIPDFAESLTFGKTTGNVFLV